MDTEIAREAESYIEKVLSIVKSNLDKDSTEAVKHYLYHAEYEMAFEGLFIEIMSLSTIPSIDWNKSVEVAKKLKLNEESVFDSNFWIRFSKYIEDKNNDGILK